MPSLAELGAEVGMSPHHLQRVFKKFMGVSPRQYAEARRLDRFKTQLRDGEPIASALYGAGFGSTSRLYERANERLGMTPASYQKGGVGVVISYGTAACQVGRVLVAATERGICHLSMGAADKELADVLAEEFPAAKIVKENRALEQIIGVVIDMIAGRPADVDALPLDVLATAFQSKVWASLIRIPPGETRTYKEIAMEIGAPKSARAVGRACATNPVSVIIPCHRAVGSDGKLHGYRWGLERKTKLIANERQATAP